MGYSTKIVTGVWVGHHENKAMGGGMEQKTGPIWREYMKNAHQGLAGAGDKWTQPAGMKRVCINTTTGYSTTSGGKCDIFPSWYTPRTPDNSKTAVIDSVSGKLATECTPEKAKQTITGGGLRAELPSSDSNYNNWMRPIQQRYGGSAGGFIPTEKDDVHTCDPAEKPKVTLSNPTKLPNGDYSIEATFSMGKYPLTNLTFSEDGVALAGASYDITSNGSISYVYKPSGTGTKTITAQVNDSVMYDASDTRTITVSAPTTTTPTTAPPTTPLPPTED